MALHGHGEASHAGGGEAVEVGAGRGCHRHIIAESLNVGYHTLKKAHRLRRRHHPQYPPPPVIILRHFSKKLMSYQTRLSKSEGRLDLEQGGKQPGKMATPLSINDCSLVIAGCYTLGCSFRPFYVCQTFERAASIYQPPHHTALYHWPIAL